MCSDLITLYDGRATFRSSIPVYELAGFCWKTTRVILPVSPL